MAPDNTLETAVARGRRAEDLACTFLEAHGYRMVQRNHRCAGGEVDVIAWHGTTLCFVEIRARASDAFGHPLETIDAAKIQRVVRAARHFLEAWQGPMPVMRFDALGIVLSDPPQFTLAEEAFETTCP